MPIPLIAFRLRWIKLLRAFVVLDDDRKVFNSDNSSVQEESNFSDGALIRHHKKGFSLSDFSAFAQSFRLSRTDISTKNNGEEEVNGHNGGVKITKAITLDKEKAIVFSPRCLSTNPFHCKLPENAKKLVEEEESAMTFHPGDNFLLMETSVINLFWNLLLIDYK